MGYYIPDVSYIYSNNDKKATMGVYLNGWKGEIISFDIYEYKNGSLGRKLDTPKYENKEQGRYYYHYSSTKNLSSYSNFVAKVKYYQIYNDTKYLVMTVNILVGKVHSNESYIQFHSGY